MIVAEGPASVEGQGGELNGFKGFSPTGQGRELGAALGGAKSIVGGDDPGGDITTVDSGGACVMGSGSGDVLVDGPPDDTVARLVTAPLGVMGAHCSSCAGLSV